MIIAVDGPAASGKGTLTERLADHFDLARLDTGLIYRAVGAKILRDNDNPEDPVVAVEAARALCFTDLKQDGLRLEEARPGGFASSSPTRCAGRLTCISARLCSVSAKWQIGCRS